MKNMKSLSLLAALSLCGAPSAFAGSDQALGLAYKAASTLLAAGAAEEGVPPVQAKPVQPALTEFERKALALYLTVLTNENKAASLRLLALQNIKAVPPGPHDKEIRSALNAVIEATPTFAVPTAREQLTENAMQLLTDIALRSDAAVTREAVESLRKVFARPQLKVVQHRIALEHLIAIAKAKPDVADDVLPHLIEAVDYQYDEKIPQRALNAIQEIARERANQIAADPIPGPVKLERIP